jgi:hypothetical protein
MRKFSQAAIWLKIVPNIGIYLKPVGWVNVEVRHIKISSGCSLKNINILLLGDFRGGAGSAQ